MKQRKAMKMAERGEDRSRDAEMLSEYMCRQSGICFFSVPVQLQMFYVRLI